MPQLTWIGKDKVENHDKDLPFRVLKTNKKLSEGDGGSNLVIQGDNLEALKALMPFYYHKVKCIYIDPPYNTGSEKWVYNDRVNSPQIKAWINKVVGPEGEDLCRHDKWLCMMYPRLKLLKELLTDDGVIFVSIDDNEQHHLRNLMDEIFDKSNFITNIIWQKKFSPQNDAKYFSDNHDFIVVYAKNKNSKGNQTGWIRNLLPRNEITEGRYSNPDNDPRGDWTSGDLSVKTYSKDYDYPITTPSGRIVNPPRSRSWSMPKTSFNQMVSDNRIWFGKEGNNVPRIKRFRSEVQEGVVPLTIWSHTEVGHNQEAKQELNKIIPGAKISFDTPKPVRLINRILEIATDKNSIIVDSFAGSGTTGQAVLELNKKDQGHRKFVLVELEKNIAEEVIAKRLSKVIKGYKDGKYPDGTGQGFQYLDLNGELFNRNGFINDVVNYEDLASYIYFTETKSYLDLKTIDKPFIGSYGSTNYFLLFERKGKNVLDEKALKQFSKYSGKKVIFADKTLLDDDYCEKHNIVFKQIPYELKKY